MYDMYCQPLCWSTFTNNIVLRKPNLDITILLFKFLKKLFAHKKNSNTKKNNLPIEQHKSIWGNVTLVLFVILWNSMMKLSFVHFRHVDFANLTSIKVAACLKTSNYRMVANYFPYIRMMRKLWSQLKFCVCWVYCVVLWTLILCDSWTSRTLPTEHPEHPEPYQRDYHDLPTKTDWAEPSHASWSWVVTGPWCTQFHTLESDSGGSQTSYMTCWMRYIGFNGSVISCATFYLVVDKTIFMWLIHTCQLSWNTELTCFIQDILDLEVLTWNICLPQPAFIHKMSVLQINIEFGEVYDLIDVFLSSSNKDRLTCSSNILFVHPLIQY